LNSPEVVRLRREVARLKNEAEIARCLAVLLDEGSGDPVPASRLPMNTPEGRLATQTGWPRVRLTSADAVAIGTASAFRRQPRRQSGRRARRLSPGRPSEIRHAVRPRATPILTVPRVRHGALW